MFPASPAILDADAQGSLSFARQWRKGIIVLAISALACFIALALVWRIYQPQAEYTARVKMHHELALSAEQTHTQAQSMLYLQQALITDYARYGEQALLPSSYLIQQLSGTTVSLQAKVALINQLFVSLCNAHHTANATSAQQQDRVEADVKKTSLAIATVTSNYQLLLSDLRGKASAANATERFDQTIKSAGRDLAQSSQALAASTQALANEMIDHTAQTDQWLLIVAMASIFAALVWSGVQLVFLGRSLRSNSKMHSEMKRIASIDPLTGVLNRRGFKHALAAVNLKTHHNKRLTDPSETVMMVIDLDFFKVFNDTYGHLAGDEHLRQCVQLWQAQLRSSDILARMGGEEFVIFMTGCSEEQALQKFTQLLSVMPKGSTFSAGIALNLPNDSFESWYLRADRALYRAKHQGRACAVLASQFEPDDSNE